MSSAVTAVLEPHMGAPTGVAPCAEHTLDVTFSSYLTCLQESC